MSSRGTLIIQCGPGLDAEYRTSRIFECGAKLLEGVSNEFHSLPDYSHSKNAVYVKFSEGSFREIRIYGDDYMPIIEIGYHSEPTINNGDRTTKVWHMHIYDGLDRGDAEWLTEEVKIKYATYIKEMNNYINKEAKNEITKRTRNIFSICMV